MTPIDFKTSAASYAAHSLGVRRAYDTADAYVVGRFAFSDELDAYPWGRRVPTVAHVWEYLILPTLDPEAPINEDAIRASLDALPRRYDGGQGRRAPLPGREHMDDARDATRKLTPYYAGLYAALHMLPLPGTDFDREAFLTDLFAYGHAYRSRILAPAGTSTERVRAYRSRKADSESRAILDAFDAAMEAGDIVLGQPITRAALAESIGLELAFNLSDRRIFEVLRSADDLGVSAPISVTERQTVVYVDGVRTRTRVFVFTEGDATRTTDDPPQETTMNATTEVILDRIVAELKDEVRADLAAYLAQRDAHTTTPAPVTDLDTYRARRAA
ncbi:hypothetical protein AB0N61_00350 [Microbacterium sp. NPDC089320]|uniref:hypothetical protein n=1 Tax=Microbacterium sp. NPDC089320 TaxID=3155182 RepID=UPI0034236184